MDIIAIIGLVIALITFIWQFYFNPKEEYSHLKVQFKANQRLSLQVQRKLEQYINKYDAGDQYLMPGITYQDYLLQMRKSFEENLSDRLLKELDSLKLSKSNIDSMVKSLEVQHTALSQIDSQLCIKLDSYNT